MKKLFLNLLIVMQLFIVISSTWANNLKLNPREIFQKSLKKLGDIDKTKSFYITGIYDSELKTFKTEKYPKKHSSFEYYADKKINFFKTNYYSIISDYKNSWLKKNKKWVKIDEKTLKIFQFCDIINILRGEIQNEDFTVETSEEHIILTSSDNCNKKYIFNKDYVLLSMTISDSIYNFENYKIFGKVYFPEKIIRINKSVFSSTLCTFNIAQVQLNFPVKDYFVIPKKHQIFMKNKRTMKAYAGSWAVNEMMSRNLEAMREVYGKDLNFCLHIALKNHKSNDSLILIQLTFKDIDAASKYLSTHEKNKKITLRWQIEKHVFMLEGDSNKDKLIDYLKKAKIIFGF